jgi:hypothetical protein
MHQKDAALGLTLRPGEHSLDYPAISELALNLL